MLFPAAEISAALLDTISRLLVWSWAPFLPFFAGVKGLQKSLRVDEGESRTMAIPGWPAAPQGTVTIQCNAQKPVITRVCFGYGGRRKGTYDFLL